MNGHLGDSKEDAAAERRAIIAKYDAGRVKGNEILSWEDPALEVYHVTDRYGFIHDSRLPEKLTAYEAKVREVEKERLKKWIRMIKGWEGYAGTIKLKKRVYKGIPNQLRGEVWARLLGVDQIMVEQEGKYEEMVLQARHFSNDIRQIDLDVNRTFRNNIMFRERYGVKQQALFRLLTAYSVYNSEVGYCQGMSQIAALLLMFMNEEEAFWGLSVLMTDSKHAMHGFFIPGFPKLKRFQNHHDKILKKMLRGLKKHLDKYDIHTSLYTLKWFFQCFLDRVPFSLTLRLWDIYMQEGEMMLTAMSYTLMKLHKKPLLKMDMEELVDFLQVRLEQDFGYRDDEAIEALQTSMEELDKKRLLYPGQAPLNELPQKPFGLIPKSLSMSSLESMAVPKAEENRHNGSTGHAIHQITMKVTSDSDTAFSYSVDSTPQVSFPNSPSPESSTDFPLRRSLSLYDNVDFDESLQAAYRLSLSNADPDLSSLEHDPVAKNHLTTPRDVPVSSS